MGGNQQFENLGFICVPRLLNLYSVMVGFSMRSTMDIDTTAKGQNLSLENAKRIVGEIANIQIDDGVAFVIKDAENIQDMISRLAGFLGTFCN